METNGEDRSTKRTRFALSQETIAIVTVGVALAGLILMNHGQIRAETEAMRAEARADRQAFADRIIRLVGQQGTLNGLVEGLQHASPPRAHRAETSER